MRHAEAQAAQPQVLDLQRPLTTRGQTEALDAAQCIADAGARVDAVLASTSVRTRETAQILAAHLDATIPIQFDAALYLGDVNALILRLQRCNARWQTVLLIAHNPGISELASLCMGKDQSIELRTAGLCQAEFDRQSWRGLRPAAAASFKVLR